MRDSSYFGRFGCTVVAVLMAASAVLAQDSGTPSTDATAYIEGVTGSAQPDQAALERIRQAGYAAVIDLRGPEEDRGLEDERAVVERLGMSYIPLPILGAGEVTYANANELDRLLAQFDRPVLVHCGSGNRAGALLALRASLNGADEETAVKAGKETGLTRLEDVVRQRMQDR